MLGYLCIWGWLFASLFAALVIYASCIVSSRQSRHENN